MAQKTAAQVANEQARKDIYAQGELMRQQALMNQGDFYEPTNYEAGVNRGGGIFSFGQDFGSPYRTDSLEDLKQTVPSFSPVEFGDAETLTPLEGIQQVDTLTQQYYDNLDKLNMLGKTAASQGWNITEANVGDPNKREMSNYYQTLKAQTLDLGNALKQGAVYEKQGREKGFELENEGVATNLGGESIGHITTAGDVVDMTQYDKMVDEVNSTLAKEFSRSADYKAANDMLNEKRAFLEGEIARFPEGTERGRRARIAYESLGRAAKNLGEEELAFKKKKWNTERKDKSAMAKGVANDLITAYDLRKYTEPNKDGLMSQDVRHQQLYIDGKGHITKVFYNNQTGERTYAYEPYTYNDKGKIIEGKYGEEINENDALPPAHNLFNLQIGHRYGKNAIKMVESMAILDEMEAAEKGHGIFTDDGEFHQYYKGDNPTASNVIGRQLQQKEADVLAAITALRGRIKEGEGTQWGIDNPIGDSDVRNQVIDDYLNGQNNGYSVSTLGNGFKDFAMAYQLDLPKDNAKGYTNMFLVPSTAGGEGNDFHVIGINQDGTKELVNIGSGELKEDGYSTEEFKKYFSSNGMFENNPAVIADFERISNGFQKWLDAENYETHKVGGTYNSRTRQGGGSSSGNQQSGSGGLGNAWNSNASDYTN